MRIEKSDLIAGFTAVDVRNLLRKVDEFVNAGFAAIKLGTTEEKAQSVLEELAGRGFLEVTNGYFRMTTKGAALAQANAGKSTRREVAERRLEEFLQRVSQVNEEARFLHKVTKVVLFGSMLKSSPVVNDIDLAIKTMRKENDFEKYDSLCEDHSQDAEDNGKKFRSWFERQFWAEQEVWDFLRNRSRLISLLEYDRNEPIVLSGPHKVLFLA